MINPNLNLVRSINVLIAICLCSTSSITWACCSLAPASFRETKGLAAEVLKDGHIVHLLGYQNSVVNGEMRIPQLIPVSGLRKADGSFKPYVNAVTKSRKAVTPPSSSGNAMILPIPAMTGSMSEKNIIDTSSCPNFLDDLDRVVVPPLPPNYPISRSHSYSPAAKPVPVIFDHDIYTIVLSQDTEQIPKVLQHVKPERRPNLNPDIFTAYKKWYPGWTFALCCFSNKEEAKAKPMLWWYIPRNPDKLFFPALDAHNGAPPEVPSRGV